MHFLPIGKKRKEAYGRIHPKYLPWLGPPGPIACIGPAAGIPPDWWPIPMLGAGLPPIPWPGPMLPWVPIIGPPDPLAMDWLPMGPLLRLAIVSASPGTTAPTPVSPACHYHFLLITTANEKLERRKKIKKSSDYLVQFHHSCDCEGKLKMLSEQFILKLSKVMTMYTW